MDLIFLIIWDDLFGSRFIWIKAGLGEPALIGEEACVDYNIILTEV